VIIRLKLLPAQDNIGMSRLTLKYMNITGQMNSSTMEEKKSNSMLKMAQGLMMNTGISVMTQKT
jgi:hypothetical protein